MNKIKKCSISGIAFTFEEAAYNRLAEYIDSLKRAYKGSSECDEIIADIEARVAELVLSAQSSAEQVVCLPLVENIIAQLGTAEDISGEQSAPATDTRIARRLYRDMENHKLGGVCAGIGKYFDIDPVWVRIAIFTPLILLPISGIRYMGWADELGSNLFLVMCAVYLILWFVIPVAKSAREKLEMEGEAVTVKAIASRQQSTTDEQQAKSTLASCVTWIGRVAIVLIKLFVCLMIFPLVVSLFALIICAIASATGIGASLLQFGNLGSIAETISTFGATLPIFTIAAVAVPIGVIIYLLVTLLLGKRPKWWVMICGLILWILLLVATITTATKVMVNMNGDEVERILKSDWDDAIESEPMDMDEYNRLLHDPNVESID